MQRSEIRGKLNHIADPRISLRCIRATGGGFNNPRALVPDKSACEHC